MSYEFDPNESINPLLPGLGAPHTNSPNDFVPVPGKGYMTFRQPVGTYSGKTEQDDIDAMRSASFGSQAGHENPNAQQNVGESRNAHFNDGAAPHNGMNENPEIPRFGADDVSHFWG